MKTTNPPLNPPNPTPAPNKQRRESRQASPVLGFTPTAWAKLLHFCHAGETEIGGFAITSPTDPLRIEDFVTVKQSVTCVSVKFDDEAVADFFEGQVDAGRRPDQFARIWLHTHPGSSAQPSLTDEETFQRVFGTCHWAIMFILSRTGSTYARLRFNVGPGGQVLLPVQVDHRCVFAGSDLQAWNAEYHRHIFPEVLCGLDTSLTTPVVGADRVEVTRDWHAFGTSFESSNPADADDWIQGFESLDAVEQRLVLDELASRPELWTSEGGFLYE